MNSVWKPIEEALEGFLYLFRNNDVERVGLYNGDDISFFDFLGCRKRVDVTFFDECVDLDEYHKQNFSSPISNMSDALYMFNESDLCNLGIEYKKVVNYTKNKTPHPGMSVLVKLSYEVSEKSYDSTSVGVFVDNNNFLSFLTGEVYPSNYVNKWVYYPFLHLTYNVAIRSRQTFNKSGIVAKPVEHKFFDDTLNSENNICLEVFYVYESKSDSPVLKKFTSVGNDYFHYANDTIEIADTLSDYVEIKHSEGFFNQCSHPSYQCNSINVDNLKNIGTPLKLHEASDIPVGKDEFYLVSFNKDGQTNNGRGFLALSCMKTSLSTRGDKDCIGQFVDFDNTSFTEKPISFNIGSKARKDYSNFSLYKVKRNHLSLINFKERKPKPNEPLLIYFGEGSFWVGEVCECDDRGDLYWSLYNYQENPIKAMIKDVHKWTYLCKSDKASENQLISIHE